MKVPRFAHLVGVCVLGLAAVPLACGSDPEETTSGDAGSDAVTEDGRASVDARDVTTADASSDSTSDSASDSASDSGTIGDAGADGPYDGSFEAGAQTTRTLAAGSLHACVIRAGGSVRCWGSNEYGQLGSAVDGGVGVSVKSPAVVVPDVANAVEVTAGYGHSCALISGGTVKCWGRGNAGQLGDDLSQSSATARTVKDLTNAVSISSHWDYSCALRSDKHVVCWGGNGGRIGDNTLTTRPKPTEPIGISDAVAVAAAWGHTTVIRANGSAKAWGTYNVWGQIGDGFTQERLAPVDVLNVTTGAQIASGSYHSCAILAGGTVRCWGNAQSGAIGLGVQDSNPHATPQDVPGLADVVALGLGGATSCAITSVGKVYCWGGRTGHPTTGASSSPLEVPGLAAALEIKGNNEHMCALFAGGVVKCWGDNSYNQLGNGTGTNSQTPVTVPGL